MIRVLLRLIGPRVDHLLRPPDERQVGVYWICASFVVFPLNLFRSGGHSVVAKRLVLNSGISLECESESLEKEMVLIRRLTTFPRADGVAEFGPINESYAPHGFVREVLVLQGRQIDRARCFTVRTQPILR